jgi:hypothetical protein
MSTESDSYKDVNLAISSAITSYARIYMNKIKLDILKNGGDIYYTDTDSIVTNKPLDDKLVGADLGQFKLEYKILYAFFVSSKVYYAVTDQLDEDGNNVIVKRAKGVLTDDLTEADYKLLYNAKEVKAVRNQAKINYTGGYTNLKTVVITLSGDAYKNRTKIYDKDM